MMKTLIFAGGLVSGIAVGSMLSPEQRDKVAERLHSGANGQRANRIKKAAKQATGSVADAATSAVETTADAVSAKAEGLGERLTPTATAAH